jgi:hypothetical protein
VRPKELSPFVGPKSKNFRKIGPKLKLSGAKKRFPSAEHSQSAKFGDSQAKQGRDLTASILVQFF